MKRLALSLAAVLAFAGCQNMHSTSSASPTPTPAQNQLHKGSTSEQPAQMAR